MEREYEAKAKTEKPTGKYSREEFGKEISSHVSERERKKAHFLSYLNKKTQKYKGEDIPRQSIKKKMRDHDKRGQPVKRPILEESNSCGKYVSKIVEESSDSSEESKEDDFTNKLLSDVVEFKKTTELFSHSVYVKKISQEKKRKTKRVEEPYREQNEKTVLRKFKAGQEKKKDNVQAIEELKQKVIKAAAKIKEAIEVKSTVGIVLAAILLALIVLISVLLITGVSAVTAVGSYMLGVTMTEDLNMTEAESYFAEKEMLLQETLDHITEEYPDYDEYVFDVDEIGHDPFLLMAYLSSAHKGYTLSDIQGILDSIFESLYKLTLLEKVEERERLVFDEELNEWVEETYEVKVLYITLRKNELESILEGLLTTEDEREMFAIYKDTGGAHQSFDNSFSLDWRAYISSDFGWRIHPISGMEKFHNGVDIALPLGTPIGSSSKGKVILSYYSESAGNYVVVEDKSGYRCHYMHLDRRMVSEGDEVDYGQIIGTVGNTGNSTGAHLHLGVQNEDGKWINPVFVVSDYVRV